MAHQLYDAATNYAPTAVTAQTTDLSSEDQTTSDWTLLPPYKPPA